MSLNTSGNLCRATIKNWIRENWNYCKNTKRFMMNVSASVDNKSMNPQPPQTTIKKIRSDQYESDSEDRQAEVNEFRPIFKKYKKRVPPPDFSEVIDIRENENRLKSRFLLKSDQNSTLEEKQLIDELGLIELEKWRVCEFSDRPGLYLMPGLLRKDRTSQWLKRAFQYAEPPNTTNLTEHGCSPKSNVLQEAGKSLRWTTLGIEYDWNTKKYPESGRSLPKELEMLAKIISRRLGLGEMKPDAAIVNYYPPKSTLSAHVDRSERSAAPLISLSIGQTAVYLTGGKTLAEKPIGIWLRNGDVLVMHDEQRLVYHAIPCIGIKSQAEIFEKNEVADEKVREYLNSSRVNITIRQVN